MRLRKCKARISCAIAVLLCLAACASGGGVTFQPEEMNKPLPDDFRNRWIYDRTDIAKYDLAGLVGHILICVPDPARGDAKKCDPVLPRVLDASSEVKVEFPKSLVYRSKIDNRASAQGSYLVLASKLSAGAVQEITITDSMLAYVPPEQVPTKALVRFAKQNPKPANKTRVWIRGALLASIVTKDYQRIEANAQGVVGPVTGLGAGVYQGREGDAYDWRISLDAFDIDETLLEFGATPPRPVRGVITQITGW